MTNTNTTTAVNISEVEVDALKAQWEAAIAAQNAAHAANVACPSSTALSAVRAAMAAEQVAHDAWKAGERALQARWSAELAADEEARLQAMCEAYETLEHDYADYRAGFLTEPLPYMVTAAGMTYLDHHYHTDSEAGMLAAGGDSPYGDGRTGFVQPTPAHPCYVNGVADMDALSRYEDLSY